MRLSRSQSLSFALLSAFVLAPLATAFANDLTINYYTIAETDKDANNLAGGLFNNEVQNSLGINGLPVLNTTAYGCLSDCYSPSGAPTDVLADGEINYWSPTLNNGGPGATSDVTFTGSGTVSLPFSVPSNFFPPNGTGESDYGGFQAATLSGTLYAPTSESINFTIGSDDMAFAYLDGQVVCDDGGVHGSASVPCTSGIISAGNHTLEVFFVDINNSQSGLTFSVDTEGIVTDATPEPGTMTLLGSGLLALAGLARRKMCA
ncbi:MAG: PEP-CTERM sorting domain-containing protein [Terracidiphilus sp.]